MRYILLLSLLFISCQKKVSATLIVNIKPNDSNVKTQIFQYPAKLYKNSKFYKKISQPEYPVSLPQSIKIDSLENGNYTFEYPDLYGDYIKQNITVDKSKTYYTTIYPDVTNKVSEKNIISNLKNGENLEIKMNSRGCFHSSKSSFRILKKNNQLEISRNKISKILNVTQEKYLINLENSIRMLDDGGCTTSDIIIFVFNNKTDTIIDSGCQFLSLEKMERFLKRNGL